MQAGDERDPLRDEGERNARREEAAHERRNWVRLTFACNNRCLFCLDSEAHTGEKRSGEEIRAQVLEGRKAGATRLVLSGGEPTIHPDFLGFVRLGKLAGYSKIQTVTNGRLFQYPEFLERCVEAGLTEVTFSVHGPEAAVHDALVGVPGAFAQTTAGLRRALADGRIVVNVDVVLNRVNVPHLPAMLELFLSWGVREFDLLQVVPFGRAYLENREELFYDLGEMRPYLREALAISRREGVHLWLNRFPPEHLEGYEELIQDPYKLNDEVRGRKEEFARLLGEGVELDCRDERDRCRFCFLDSFCRVLRETRSRVEAGAFDVVRVDTESEGRALPTFGGDPATARRVLASASAAAPAGRTAARPAGPAAGTSGGTRLWIVAPDVPRGREAVRARPGEAELELELESYAGLLAALEGGRLDGRRVAACVAADAGQAEELLSLPGGIELVVLLTADSAPWLLQLESVPRPLALRMPSWDRMSWSRERDVDLGRFFERFRLPVPVEGVPECILGRAPRQPRSVLDTSMLEPGGGLEIFRFTGRFVDDLYRTKALGCRDCARDDECQGLHVNYVRAHGYAAMRPIAGR